MDERQPRNIDIKMDPFAIASNSPSGRPYPSRALYPDRQEIRVLRLHSGEYGTDVSCGLEIASLGQYTWKCFALDNYNLGHVPDRTESRSIFSADDEDCFEAVKQHRLQPRTCRSQCRSARGARYQDSTEFDPVSIQIPACASQPCQCFEAVSYTWGSSSEDNSITLCGEAGFSVTNNLFRALQRLRYSDADRVIWVRSLQGNCRYYAASIKNNDCSLSGRS